MKEHYGLRPNWQQPKGKKHPDLSNNSIHLWWLPLQLNDKQEYIALSLLSDIQRDKYHRRRTIPLQKTYLAGRYYLLNLLSKYTKQDADKILLSYSSLNKPYLSNDEHDIQFNFTDTNFHNQSHGLFVFCKKRPVGVDIESLNRKANFSAISTQRFTPAEQEYVNNRHGNIDQKRCLSIWTRKEAYGKAVGKGINYKMNQVDLVENDAYDINLNIEHQDWRLIQLQLNDELISCVVHQGHQSLDILTFNSANHLP